MLFRIRGPPCRDPRQGRATSCWVHQALRATPATSSLPPRPASTQICDMTQAWRSLELMLAMLAGRAVTLVVEVASKWLVVRASLRRKHSSNGLNCMQDACSMHLTLKPFFMESQRLSPGRHQ